MINHLLGPVRPPTRGIVGKSPEFVKQATCGAQSGHGHEAARHRLPANVYVADRRHWFTAWLLMVASSLLLCGFGPPRLVDREIAPTARVSVGELRALSEANAIAEVTAQSYLVYDVTSDNLLFAQASHDALPLASLTKLMTALLVLERADLRASVEIVAEDMSDGASMGLVVGDVVTVTDLLWGLLLPSGNDAALSLARFVAGSVDAFVADMNARAAELGMQRSHFENPHGMDAEGHVSSAADLVLLTRTLWQYPLFRTMVGTARIQWNGRTLVNTNEWLSTFAGATGVKTGTTDRVGECLIATVERDGSMVLLIVMGSQERYADAERLYAAYEAAYWRQQVNGRELSIMNRVFDETGKVWYMQPTGEAPVLLQNQVGVPSLRSYRRLALQPDVALASGTQIGELEWWVGGELIGVQDLVVR